MHKKKSIKFYCFSPVVMLTTFFIEIGAALFTLFRYHHDRAAQLIIAILGFLAFFQFAEYMVCEQTLLISSLDWARLGYVAITMLPPLGMHLGMHIAQTKNSDRANRFLIASYATAGAFITFFLFVGNGMQGEQCLGNYVIFSIAPYAALPYGFYYYGWLFTGIYFFIKKQASLPNKNHKQALIWLSIGYLSFIIPTLAVYLSMPETIKGIPSIMCGFAVFLALCLLFKVAPLVLKKRSLKNGKIDS